MQPRLHLPLLLLSLFLVSPVHGSTLSMKRHQTDPEQYREHLARRGITLSHPERAAGDIRNMKRERRLAHRQNGGSSVREPNKRGKLVTRYHPEYDPHILPNDVSKSRPQRREEAITTPNVPSASSYAGASALSNAIAPSALTPSAPLVAAAEETHQGDMSRGAVAVDTPNAPSSATLSATALSMNSAPAASSIPPLSPNSAPPPSRTPLPMTNQRGVVYTVEATIGGDSTKIPILVSLSASVRLPRCDSAT